jgi:hypothetical protein
MNNLTKKSGKRSHSQQTQKTPRSKSKEVKVLCNKNHQTPKKKIEEGNRKDSPCSWIGRINIVKMDKLLKAIY